MTLQQTMEEFKLQMSQFDGLIEPNRFKSLRNQSQRAIIEDFRMFGGLGMRSVRRNSFESRQHLLNLKGFRHVVISTRVKPLNFLLGLPQGGEHENGNIGVRSSRRNR